MLACQDGAPASAGAADLSAALPQAGQVSLATSATDLAQAAGVPAAGGSGFPAPSQDEFPAAGAPGTLPVANRMWCDALSVFQTSCQTCHGAPLAGGAPFSLVSYEDAQAPSLSEPSAPIYELIGRRIHDPARPMPPLSQPALSEAQLAAIDTWLAAGAPDATGACAAAATEGAAPEEPEWPEDCEEWYEIRATDHGKPHIVPADTEEELDFDIPVPWSGQGSGPVQALAIRPLTNNKRVVHHWILYAGTFDFITSWSPGKPMEVFPEGVGVHMPSDGTFRLDMHYYNVGSPSDEPDESGLEVCITRNPRPNTATTFMFTGSATAPALSKVTNVSTCNVTATEPVHLITSSPHMHSYGVHAKLEVVRPNGDVELLEDNPFNWEDQHVTPINAVIETGDQVRITCVYENNTARNVAFGPSSDDEMCFNFARYYPMDALSCPGTRFR